MHGTPWQDYARVGFPDAASSGHANAPSLGGTEARHWSRAHGAPSGPLIHVKGAPSPSRYTVFPRTRERPRGQQWRRQPTAYVVFLLYLLAILGFVAVHAVAEPRARARSLSPRAMKLEPFEVRRDPDRLAST